MYGCLAACVRDFFIDHNFHSLDWTLEDIQDKYAYIVSYLNSQVSETLFSISTKVIIKWLIKYLMLGKKGLYNSENIGNASVAVQLYYSRYTFHIALLLNIFI